MNRRTFLKLVGAAACGVLVPLSSMSMRMKGSESEEAVFHLYNYDGNSWHKLAEGTIEVIEKKLETAWIDNEFLLIGTNPTRENDILRIDVKMSTRWT